MRSRRALTVLLATGLLGSLLSAPAQAIDKGKEKKIRELLKVSGTTNMLTQTANQAIDQMKASIQQNKPKASKAFWTNFAKIANVNALIDSQVAVYDKHLQPADLDGLITFYNSAIGKKFVAVQPQLAGDQMRAFQEWGQGIMTKVEAALKNEK